MICGRPGKPCCQASAVPERIADLGEQVDLGRPGWRVLFTAKKVDLWDAGAVDRAVGEYV